jgi:hypothetical protein
MPGPGPRLASLTEPRSTPATRYPRGATAAAGSLVLAGVLVVAHAARAVTFSGDDWLFITLRRGFNAGVFLRPHNEHLSALPIAAYKLLLALFGASSYVPFMVLLLLLHAVVCLLVYFLAREHIGPWAALAPTAILAVLGPAWQDLLWAFQIGYLGSVASGLGMILCLRRRSRRGDAGASGLLLASLLCSSIGVAMIVLGALLVVLARPREPRRLWAIGVPVALYLLWYAFYGVTTIRTQNIAHVPRYVFTALAAAVSSITGLAQTHTSPFIVSTSVGRYVALAAVLLLIYHLARGGRLSPTGWSCLVALVVLWVAECLEYSVPGRSAPQSRYQYTAATLVLLVVISAVTGRRLHQRGALVLAVLVAAICGSNISMLDQRSGFWAQNASYVYAETGAMLIARDSMRANFTPENGLTIPAIGNHNLVVQAGPYLSAVQAFGSAADVPAGILLRPEKVREAADLTLAGAERLSLEPAPGRAGRRAPRCRVASDGRQLGELSLGQTTLRVQVGAGVPAELQLRRFASGYRLLSFGNVPRQFHLPRLDAGRPLLLRLPPDRSSVPWHARILGGRDVVACMS